MVLILKVNPDNSNPRGEHRGVRVNESSRYQGLLRESANRIPPSHFFPKNIGNIGHQE